MNVCFVNTTDLIGGAERCSFDLLRGLRDRDHRASLVVGRKLSGDSDVHPCHYPAWDWKPRAFLNYRAGLTDTTLLTPFRMIRRHEAFNSAQAVSIHNMHGSYWNFWTVPYIARLKPVVLTLHDEWLLTGDCAYTYDCDRWMRSCGNCPQMKWEHRPALGGRDATAVNVQLKRLATRAARRERVTIVTPSEWLTSRARRSPHLSRFDAITIPNGIDLDTYSPQPRDESKARLGLPRFLFGFLFFANNISDPRKGAPLLDAMLARRGLPDRTLLHVVGNGAEALAAKFPGLPIHAAGYLSDQSAIAECLSAADCLLLLSAADNLPYTGIEASACGCPILARRVGGIPEIVADGENGMLMDGNPSPDALFDAMTRMARSAADRHAGMRAAARDIAERRFGLGKFVDAYERLFLEVHART